MAKIERPRLARTIPTDWSPLTPEEIQAERADQLLIELGDLKDTLKDHGKEATEIKEAIRDLQQQIKTAKRLSTKQRARINTLDRQWRRQWVKEYDRYLAEGKDKSYAAALAWSKIKVHCEKDKGGEWACPDWRSVYKAGVPHGGVQYILPPAVKPKAKKKAKRKKAKKGP